MERRIILKCQVGSYLYGTNNPESDMDFSGIFLPSTTDMLGLGNCPTEWTFNDKQSTGPRNEAGDTDCKYYSLRRFMSLAVEGQPGQLEMLYVPIDNIVEWQPEYLRDLRSARDLFASKRAIQPFIGFALAQAHKATIKGDNLNLLREIIEWGRILTIEQLHRPISAFFVPRNGSMTGFYYDPRIEFQISVNDHGFRVMEIAGRKYDVNLKTKTFLANCTELVKRYGTRAEAAAEQGHDWKSYMHAYRLLSQAEEFLLTGHITFPRPDAEFLLKIRRGEHTGDVHDEITRKLDYIRQEVMPKSVLPDLPDRGKIEELCIKLHEGHLLCRS